MSGHVAALRKELGDPLFHRTGRGVSLTPGGLRLASRAVELLGLQELTRREVGAAGKGQRILRIAVSSLFGEVAAPGLIELFSTRADDIAVEMSVWPPDRFAEMLTSRVVDVAIGPADRAHTTEARSDPIRMREFLRYQLVAVVAARHGLASGTAARAALAEETWLLGPAAADPASGASRLLRRIRVPESNQRIFQNHAAALTEARSGHGVALCASHTAADELADGRLVRVQSSSSMIDGIWATYSLHPNEATPLSNELVRFVSTPRAIQAMLAGSGTNIARFRPRVHVTLWS